MIEYDEKQKEFVGTCDKPKCKNVIYGGSKVGVNNKMMTQGWFVGPHPMVRSETTHICQKCCDAESSYE